MCEDSQGIDSNRNSGRLVAIALFEGLDFAVLHHAAHRRQVGGTFGQSRRRSGGTSGLNLYVDVRVQALKFFGPQSHHVGQSVRTNAGKVAGYTANALVVFQGRINGGKAGAGNQAGSSEGHGSEQALEFHVILLLR